MDPYHRLREVPSLLNTSQLTAFDIGCNIKTEIKDIVKRVIGMPGYHPAMKIQTLINGEETNEPYLAEYLNLFKQKSCKTPILALTAYKGVYLENLLKKHKCLTVDVNSNTSFSFTVPQGE